MFGIEFDPEEGEKARAHCDTVLTADAEALPASAFSDGFFDVIVYADVLEHMKYPECVLSMQQRWLSSDGYAIVSLPNIAFLGIRLQLLLGRFNYSPVSSIEPTCGSTPWRRQRSFCMVLNIQSKGSSRWGSFPPTCHPGSFPPSGPQASFFRRRQLDARNSAKG